MPDPWMPGASRLDVGDHAATDGGPAKAIAHITWDKNATAAAPIDLVSYESLRSYFSGGGAGAAPHILWDPFTGRCTQFVPADSRSKSLVDSAGGTRTNRAGSVVIQVEALFFPYCRVGGTVYPRLVDTPCAGWPVLHDWIRSWGVPDTWPMGKPVNFNSNRSESVWESKAGWYAHAHVPENDHQDPGSWPDFTAQEEDMPTADEIAAAVWSHTEKPGTGDPVRTGAAITWMDSVHAGQNKRLDALAAKVDALAAAVTSLTTTSMTQAQITALANEVADVQAKRLES